MASVFSRIVSGEIPAHIVGETQDFLAFLDIRPLAMGHTLVIPKRETDNIFDLDDEAFIGLQLFAKYVANGIRKAVPCTKVGVAVIGLEVPHAHIHLIPIHQVSDMDFSREKLEPTPAALAEMATLIRSNI